MVDQCNLNPDQPIPGCVVAEHDEVFDIWKRLIESKRLEVPFDLVHVDAHADMGMGFGDASVSYIMGELLHNPISQRSRPQRGSHKGLMPSNYVAFAMACGWIRSFTYVHHPNLVRENAGLHDIPNSYFKDFNPRNDELQFKAVNPESVNGNRRPTSEDVVDMGPQIPITLVPTHEFNWKKPFSYAFVAKSPRYAPATSDKLLATLGRFVAEIPECCRTPQQA
jgi:hypothetical protein